MAADTVLAEDKGFAFYASANAVSSSGTPYDAQLAYRAMASELAGLGVTLNIGPSEDACREDGLNLLATCFGTSPVKSPPSPAPSITATMIAAFLPRYATCRSGGGLEPRGCTSGRARRWCMR